jgi:hypothetical protein
MKDATRAPPCIIQPAKLVAERAIAATYVGQKADTGINTSKRVARDRWKANLPTRRLTNPTLLQEV